MAVDEPLRVEPLHPTFVAQVHGVDWSKPLSDHVVAQIKAAIDKYGVLIFRGASIDNEAHVAFTKQLGEPDSTPQIGRKGRFPGQPHIFDVSNITDSGEIVKVQERTAALMAKGNSLWHADMQYHPRRDKYSILRAVEIPPPGTGGETEFADSRTAYEDLSDEWKEKLENMVVDCSLLHNRRTAAPDLYKGVDPFDWSISRWKAVYPHEGGGRKNLYLSSYCYKIDGYTVEESQQIAEQLIAHGTQPQYVYKAAWERPGDIMMWDNTAVWHRALDGSAYQFKHRRDMRRTNTLDDGPHAWGENEAGKGWMVELPPQPLAHEKATA